MTAYLIALALAGLVAIAVWEGFSSARKLFDSSAGRSASASNPTFPPSHFGQLRGPTVWPWIMPIHRLASMPGWKNPIPIPFLTQPECQNRSPRSGRWRAAKPGPR